MTCYSTFFPVCAIKYSDRSNLSGKGFFFVWLVVFHFVLCCCFVLLLSFRCSSWWGSQGSPAELTSAGHLVSTTGNLRKRNTLNQLTFTFLHSLSWNWSDWYNSQWAGLPTSVTLIKKSFRDTLAGPLLWRRRQMLLT